MATKASTGPRRPHGSAALCIEATRSVREYFRHLRAERDMEKLLVSPEEAADMLDVARSTVYDLMRLRLLPSVKVGRYRRIPMTKLREYVDHLTDADVA